MPANFPLLEEAQSFRRVGTGKQPLFRWDRDGYVMFYAPGYLCVVSQSAAAQFETNLLASQFVRPDAPNLDRGGQAELGRHAQLALVEASRWQTEPFAPECLTLYANNECNLRCVYCFADPSPEPKVRLNLETIAAAAEVVAGSCRRKARPFYVAFHGGGEPMLHHERVEAALARLETIAARHQVKCFRYLASNGVMPEAHALWAARHFDLIGLSCDGTADIQDSQRPGWDGVGTYRIVERTARLWRAESVRLHVRATITRASLHRQAEIAHYICEQFAPEEIRFEPVYRGGRAVVSASLDDNQAGDFVARFLEAQAVATRFGIRLLSTGSRPSSIHGPYCHVFRSVINLIPGDVATACFKLSDPTRVAEKGAVIGALNHTSGDFEIDHLRVQSLRRQLGTAPSHCAGCFNQYHCAGECPDFCPLDTVSHRETAIQRFRCRVQKALAYATLRRTAEHLWFAASERVEETREVAYGTEILQ